MSFLITVLLLVWVVIMVNLDIGTIRLFSDSSQVEDIKDSVFWLFHRRSKGSILAILSALMALTVIIVIILPAICYVCAGRLDNSLVIQHLLKYVMWLIMTCGVVEAIMYPFGLADIYNNCNNVKLSRMSKVSIIFDMAEIALVILILIKLF